MPYEYSVQEFIYMCQKDMSLEYVEGFLKNATSDTFTQFNQARIQNCKYHYPIIHLLLANKMIGPLNTLIQNKDISLEVSDNGGYTILHLAAFHNRPATIESIIKTNRIPFDIPDHNGQYPCDVARAEGHTTLLNQMRATLDSLGRISEYKFSTTAINPLDITQKSEILDCTQNQIVFYSSIKKQKNNNVKHAESCIQQSLLYELGL